MYKYNGADDRTPGPDNKTHEIKAVPPHINPIDYTHPAAQPLPRSQIKTL